jgi:8-oxo-dGTP pyrophosphatase MutT (NUDIX family)
MADEVVFKATAVLLRKAPGGDEVLVFDHPLDEGGFMIQLPAGTIEPDEAPEAAAVRELEEETGAVATSPVLAGIRDEVWEGQQRRRWVYLLRAPGGLADEWPFRCDCGAPIVCHWLPLATATIAENQQPWIELAREALVQTTSPLPAGIPSEPALSEVEGSTERGEV